MRSLATELERARDYRAMMAAREKAAKARERALKGDAGRRRQLERNTAAVTGMSVDEALRKGV